MDFNDYLAKVERLGELVGGNELLRDKNEITARNCGIKSADELREEFRTMQNKERLLTVGILGRVKAGKSSFLNALFFGGREVLPRAATPMTAALTMLEYGEQMGFKAEFYNADELKTIDSRAAKFESDLTSLENEKFAALRKHPRHALKNDGQLRELARARAIAELGASDEIGAASFKQRELLRAHTLSHAELCAGAEFSGSQKDVAERLRDYVGTWSENEAAQKRRAGRKLFTPYTKSITLRVNDDFFKDVQIVDTPGLNDPVQSRSERTNEFMDKCDAVLVLSPAGQFLDNSDMGLVARLGGASATARIFFIASKADTELFGIEAERAGGDLRRTWDGIRRSLTQSRDNSLGEMCRQLDAGRDVVRRAMDEDLIVASSVCAGILAKNEQGLDENEEHILGRLESDFARDFKGAARAENLRLLANTEPLREIFAQLRASKEEILQQRASEFLSAKIEGLNKYIALLEECVEDALESLKNDNIAALQNAICELRAAQAHGADDINDEWREQCESLASSLKMSLKAKRKNFFSDLESGVESQQGTKTDTWEESASTLWKPWTWGDTKTCYDTYETVNASQIRKMLRNTCEELADLINDSGEEAVRNWKKGVVTKLLAAARRGIDERHIDSRTLKRIVTERVGSIDFPQVSYPLPSDINSKSGTLTRYAARDFVSDVERFIDELRNSAGRDTAEFLDHLKLQLQVNFGKEIFSELLKDLERREAALKEKERTQAEYETLLREIGKVAGGIFG